jgi:hypothetical protein
MQPAYPKESAGIVGFPQMPPAEKVRFPDFFSKLLEDLSDF